jgi:hypothetical protein
LTALVKRRRSRLTLGLEVGYGSRRQPHHGILKTVPKTTAAWAEGFRADHAPHVIVISNASDEVNAALNHLRAKGKNDLKGNDIVQFLHFMNPAMYERHEVMNAWADTKLCVRLAHIDMFNQSAGRNLNFRQTGASRHWVVMSPSLWRNLRAALAVFSRYGLETMASAEQARERKRAS